MLLGRRFALTVTAVAAATTMSLAGCAKNNESSGPTGKATEKVSQNNAAVKLLPAKIKSAGKLVIGTNPPYTPNEYLDPSGKVVGFDVDLLDATAKVLGLKTDYRQSAFDKIIPAIQAGTYDMGMSSFTDSKEREKSVDFVTYFSAGILWASPAGKKVDPNNACGLRVAVQTTTTEDTVDIPAKSKACVKAGKPAIKKVQFDSQDDATNAVMLGKVDAMSADSPITAYAIKKSGGKMVQAGTTFEAAPYGWPVPKGSSLAKALQQAVQTLIDNGTYDRICKRWGVELGEIKTAKINGAIS